MFPNKDDAYETLLQLRSMEHAKNCETLGYSYTGYQGVSQSGNLSPSASCTGQTKNNVADFYSGSCRSEGKYSSLGYSRITENGVYRTLSG